VAKTKLTQLEVNEVSLVDAGANQHAHVMLFKSKDGKPEGKQQAEKPESGLRKLFSAIGKALNVPDKDVEEAVSSIEKADTFSDKMEQRKKSRILDEIWDVCYALENSLCSIVRDDEVADKAAMMDQSIDEFTETIKTLTASWGNGKTAQITKAAEEIPLEHMQESANRLEGMIAKACGGTGKPASKSEGGEDDPPEDGQGEEADKGCKKSKGGIPDMKFNEANMTATDRMAFEELKKRYGVDEGDGGTTGEAAGTEQVGKKGTADQAGAEGTAGAAAGEPAAQTGAAGDDIYKGLNPAVAAELKELRKRADAAEERELLEVAKRYEIIGKKPEELVQTFKSLKAAGGTAYNDMISVLDSAVAMTEQSGVFGEIGKRGNGTGNNGTDAWSKIEKHAADIRKADPALGYAEAIDKACIQHPELVSEYEANR
jgi:hypothetical protein